MEEKFFEFSVNLHAAIRKTTINSTLVRCLFRGNGMMKEKYVEIGYYHTMKFNRSLKRWNYWSKITFLEKSVMMIMIGLQSKWTSELWQPSIYSSNLTSFLILLLDLTIKFTVSMVYTTPYINFKLKALRHVARHRNWNKNSISYTVRDTSMHLQGPYCRKIQQSNWYWFLFHYFIFSLKI